ncbi:hypothetical protein [Cohnella phaseoli]|uniref:Uncharacterized protein n=1 Tax=Cohnella phaseoli TaxID=456490 RepID=A0A3D9I339_9BACL|nr:hypothetical protein [Cohnella phaseoli]RED56177.1 hypothetical protein DFP98_14017 [Cohnella phaseoli]
MPRERSNAVSSKNAPFTGAKPSKKPIIGSHRTKSLIGGHGTQQVLDMQGMIGNQATQKFVPTVPKPTLGSHRIKTQIGGHRTKPTLESKPVTENPTTPKQLSDSLQSKPLPQGYVPFDTGETKDAGSSFDWNLGSSATTAPKSKPLPKGYVPFKDDDNSDDDDFDDDWDSKSISKSGSTTPTTNTSPSSAVGAITPEQGVFPARVREDLFDEEPDDFDDDSDDDYDDDSDNANKDELSGLIAQSLQPAGAGSSFALEKNKESEFDKDMLYGGGIRGVDLNSTTFYANESQRASYARGFDKSGKMINATDGKSLDTMGALESSTVGAKADRHIFTMNALGEFHSMDAVKENSDRSKRVHDQRKQDLKDLKDKPQLQAELRNMQLPSMERIHHSTFNAGDDIAGAGELQVRDGQVELLSDASGHYKPGSKQMVQTVQQLEKNNVPIEQLGVEFVGKPEFQYELDYLTGEDKVDPTTGKKVRRRDVDGNLMPKMQNGKQSFTKNMQVSALELLGYADHVPDAAEERMRDAHDQKNSMLRELLIKTQRHDPIAYDYRGDVQSKHASVMEELLAKRKKAAPVPDLPQEKYFGYGSISNLPGKKLVVDDNERSSRSSLPVAGDNNVKTSESDEVWGAAASNSAAIKDGGKAQARSKSYKKETAQGGSNAYNSSPLLNGSDAYNSSPLLNGSNAYNSAPLLNSSMSYNKSNGYNKPISRGYTGSKPFSYKDFDEDSYD